METNWQAAITYLGGSEHAEKRLLEKMARQVHQEVDNIAKHHSGVRQRPQHTKMLAGIKNANFQVSSNLADDLMVGFLKKGVSYPTIVRFSNAAAFVSEDAHNDLRGVAIEITPSEGSVQDFLMTNAEKHHAKDAIQAMATSLSFFKKGVLNKIIGLDELAIHVGPVEAARIIRTLKKQTKIPVERIATETYWSRAPLRIGTVVLKYRLFPVCQKVKPVKSTEDLTAELKSRLKNNDVSYEFQIQRYIDEKRTPLEDTTKAWKSPFELIGHLVIPKQNLVNDESFFENVHFNPWKINSSDFEPIGNMNRARKVVYTASTNAQKE